jgi:acyl-CoA synthetase (AMP-forming)/AMP-acid ligase II
VKPGESALIMCTPGSAFIQAFFGCLYAGIVAVPAAVARRAGSPLFGIVAAASPPIGLSNLKGDSLPEDVTFPMGWLSPDDIPDLPDDTWAPPAIGAEALAFLQYTSGSTSAPRGVMVTHGNLLANLEVIHQLFRLSRDSRCVSWLPAHHDMGLIGGILEPMYGGFPVTLFSPLAFLKRPIRWLRAITRTRATASGGPNFAWELCIDRITPEQCEGLDLSSWELGFNGAEPIRPHTLARFAEKFAPFGFRAETAYPCYGLAEATLLAAGGDSREPPVILHVDGARLDAGEAALAEGGRAVVSSGRPAPGSTLRIVDPATRTRCDDGVVGEIWLQGPCITRGYWQNPEASAETFGAVLEGHPGTFLRTGDLGFTRDGEVFVTGRAKDLIILRGRNHYPQDIELTVERSHASIAAAAAFSLDVAGQERLAIACELKLRAEPGLDEVADAVRTAVNRHHEAEVYGVLLVKPARLPRTTSGKIRRRACRLAWADGTLAIVGESVMPGSCS